MLREIAPSLWVVERPLRFLGIEIGTRMTVIRLDDGSLFLHSPVALEPEVRQDLERIGSPALAVAPNRFHHLYAGDYTAAYPDLHLFVAPGLERKRPDLPIAGVLGEEPRPEWSKEIDQTLFGGFPLANEVVFFHRPTKTLIASDLAFNLGPDSPLPTRVAMRLLGGYDRFGPTLLERLGIRDRKAARASLERILAWDFERVVIAHGRLPEAEARDALRKGYDWLFKG
ncbi:MAG: DUF4336 domain-containing protein [Candidatus Binatia bacterium]